MQVYAHTPDSIKSVEGRELEVRAKRAVRPAESPIPLESLSQEELVKTSANSLADAVRQLPSVMLKDYGGIGGLKTISVRSLGAEHTTVQLNGIKISDTQTGQIDLSKFSLENVARIELSQGNPTDDLSPARAYASASLLSITSRSQASESSKMLSMRAMLQLGSFDFFGLSASADLSASKWLRGALSFERQTASGQYRYLFRDGAQQIPLQRRNSDVHTTRLEFNLATKLASKTTLRAKAYFYDSERGLPNAAIIGNFENSQQRLWTRDAFAQATFETELASQVRMALNAKAAHNYLRFINPLALSLDGIDDRYTQREGYLSVSICFKPAAALTLAAASDAVLNDLDATLWQFAKPTRFSSYTAVGAKVREEGWSVDASLLSVFVQETTVRGEAAPKRSVLLPTLAMAFKPFRDIGFRTRAAYKQSFRMPTFNDLYYTRVGNINLRPERVELFNLGLGYELLATDLFQYAALRLDGFRNLTTDKILAIPRDAFNWSMQNIAVVEAWGVDVRLELFFKKWLGIEWAVTANYTYQTVTDVTPDSPTFGNQIAYTPFEYAMLMLSASWGKWSLVWMQSYVGYRYQLGENIIANLLPPYMLSDVSLRTEERLWELTAALKLDINNLFDEQYEVIRSFPMPGRNVRLTLSVSY
ncbi:MAG: TonB-dependent receptor [Chloroherpetonaceae bacterium]|nr:TonB-dependent receptor [Chloroherpetonaceae bacterium]